MRRLARRRDKEEGRDNKPTYKSSQHTVLSIATNNNMLVMPLKVPVRYDLRKPLTEWLDEPQRRQHNTNSAAVTDPTRYVFVRPNFFSIDCKEDLTRLASLRNCLSDSLLTRSPKVALNEGALPDCHEYHAALMVFEKHNFPTIDEAAPNLKLEWHSAISSSSATTATETHGSFVFERACVVYCISALESYLATTISIDKQRHSNDSFKQVIKHCQTAASMLYHLRKNILSETTNFTTGDLSLPWIQFWESTLLAQAQVAAYEMSKKTSSSKHTLLSFLAMGAVPLFNDALNYSKDPIICSQLHEEQAQEYSSYCKCQSMYYTALAEYHQSCASRSNTEWGLELAWIRKALASIVACRDFAQKAANNHDNTRIETLHDTIRDRQTQAQRDNEVTYGERIPQQLPQIRAQQVVKSDQHPLPDSMLQPKVPLFRNING